MEYIQTLGSLKRRKIFVTKYRLNPREAFDQNVKTNIQETNIQEWYLVRAEDKTRRGVADSVDDGEFKF